MQCLMKMRHVCVTTCSLYERDLALRLVRNADGAISYMPSLGLRFNVELTLSHIWYGLQQYHSFLS